MRGNKAKKDALINMLAKIYHDILPIEQRHDIVVSGQDGRARIEYFHDAIRAFTSGSADVYGAAGRLSVEYLSYDVVVLRNICVNPLAPLHGLRKLSPETAVIPKKELAAGGMRASKETKRLLIDLYTTYSVLFVALLAESAERNHMSRVEDKNAEVEALSMLEARLAEAESQGRVNIQAQMEAMIEDEALRKKLKAAIKAVKAKNAHEAGKVIRELSKAIDKDIAVIDKAHFTYVTSQLAIYEQSKDIVRRMAQQGMNLVGQFVEDAMAAARTGPRGR